MTRPTPQIDCDQHHPGLAVPDVPAAVDFYTQKLGFALGFTWGEPPTMAGVNLDKVQIFLEQGTPSPKGCSLYFVIGSAEELHDFQVGNGVEVVEPLGDRPWGFRDDAVKDLNGYTLTFGHRIYFIQELKRKHGIDYDSHASYRWIERE